MDSIIGTDMDSRELVHRHDAHLILWIRSGHIKFYIPFNSHFPPLRPAQPSWAS